MQPFNISLVQGQEHSFFIWFSFFFQSFFSEYIYILRRSVPGIFLFFFLEQLAAVYNLLCLFHFYGYSLDYYQRFLVRVLWRRTKTGWGKKTPLMRQKLGVFFCLGMFSSFSILEIQGYRGYSEMHFTFFNADFFYRPQRLRVFYLVHRLWWYGLSFFLYAKSYLYHYAVIRHNHYTEAAFRGERPLLRAASIGKLRFFLDHHFMKGFKGFVQERYATFLATGRFIIYKDRINKHSTTKYRIMKQRYYIRESIDEDANIVRPRKVRGSLYREGGLFYDSIFFSYLYLQRHSSVKALGSLHISYLNSPTFFKTSFYYYYYFVHCYIQQGPKKYGFATAWVSKWVSLPFIGAVFYAKRFRLEFYRSLMGRYFFFLLGSDGFIDSNMSQSLWVPWESEKSFFNLSRSFPYEVRLLNYNSEHTGVKAPFALGLFFVHCENTFDHLKGLAIYINLEPQMRFLMGRLFTFSEPTSVLPLSYPFFIYWKINNFYIFNARGPKENEPLFYFKRLHIDSFFFFRLRHFAFSLEALFTTINSATKEEFLEYQEKLQEGAIGVSNGTEVTESARLKLHVLFFFFLRDAFVKKILVSRLLTFYLFIFSLASSVQGHRAFFIDFSFSQFLKFRSHFSALFLEKFAPPEEDEPVVFFNPLAHRKLRSFYWFFLDRDYSRTVRAIGRRRGFHSRYKWFPVFPSFRGKGVSVWYMEGPTMNFSNWEYALAGESIPEPRFVENFVVAERAGHWELRLSFYFMVFGK